MALGPKLINISTELINVQIYIIFTSDLLVSEIIKINTNDLIYNI